MFSTLKTALGRLFGGRGEGETREPSGPPVEYRGYRIRATPYRTAGRFQTAGVKLAPRESLPRILLAGGRDIGMPQDALGPHEMSAGDVAAQVDHGLDLCIRKIGIVDDLVDNGDFDADRSGVDVVAASPGGRASVPGGTSWMTRPSSVMK